MTDSRQFKKIRSMNVNRPTPLWDEINQVSGQASYRHGTHRSVHPVETLKRISPLLPRAGITRLADITGLDWVGVPVYQAVRPLSRNLSVSQGKGLTHAQAKVSALMEAIELFHAEAVSAQVTWSTVADMRPNLSYAPDSLTLSPDEALLEDISICWLRGVNLMTGRPEWIPRDLCWLDLTVGERLTHSPFIGSSNGLASGNTYGEAIIHGMCEVIERDSIARARLGSTSTPNPLDVSTVGSQIVRGLVARLETSEIDCLIVDVTGPTGVPCFEVELKDRYLQVSVSGSGCHVSQTTAMIRAITEACQTRLTYIAGTRDDLKYPDVEFFQPAPPRNLSTVPTGITAAPLRRTGQPPWPHSFAMQVADLTKRIRNVTGWAPIAVDLSLADFGIPVVFVVAPGLLFDTRHRSITRLWRSDTRQ